MNRNFLPPVLSLITPATIALVLYGIGFYQLYCFFGKQMVLGVFFVLWANNLQNIWISCINKNNKFIG